MSLPEISIGSTTSNAISGHTTPERAIADIQSGKWAKQIAALRSATGDEADNLKRLLPAFLWTGKFTARKNSGIEKFSGLICADIDKVASRVGEIHDLARSDPHAVGVFVSPSGTGIKIVFRVPLANDAKAHRRNFLAVRAHVAEHYLATVDEAAKDVARLCFVSHDPAAFYNAEAIPLAVNDEAPAPEVTVNGTAIGTRNNRAFELSCEARDTGRTPDEARAIVREFAAGCNPPLPESEADGCVKSAFSQPPHFRPRPLPEILDAAEFLAQSLLMPPELIAGLLHKGSKLALGGNSKAFKTWLLLHMAIAVATGADWLGFPTTQGKVLLVNFEIQAAPMQRRIAAVLKATEAELRAGQLQVWNLRGHAADFRTLIPKIISRAKSEGFALVILDPLYKLLGSADENKAGDVAAMLNEIERLAVETGAAVAYLGA